MNDLINNPIVWIAGFLVLILAYYLYTLYSDIRVRNEKIIELQDAYNVMLRSFNELDEQAKLIVKTDLELNKAQDELDKRLNGLNALQRTSRQISQAMNEQQVFEKLTSNTFEDLGYSKVLIVLNDDHHEPKARLHIGFDENKISLQIDSVMKENTLKTALDEGRTLSSMNASRRAKEKLQQIFDAEHCILAPIVTQTGTLGFLLVGNRQASNNISQADEELITILAGQIGQAIENTQLFDKVFRSSQELEVKVKERTKQLASVLAQVEEVNKKKTEFISAVSHELRTPLTSIKGYAAILLAGKIGEVPPAVKERLAKINLHSDNLVNLINNLLDIARIESGRVDMTFTTYKIDKIFEDISDLLTPQLSTKDLKLKTDLPEGISEVYIDFSHAERVFINLLSNAVKFSPKGGTITISVLPTLDNGFATFRVSDMGIGIAPQDLEKLFTEFFRVENEINQSVKGTGLGLVLAKEIVSAHHGRIWVTSQVGVGTNFWFTLPTNQEAYVKAKKAPILVQEG